MFDVVIGRTEDELKKFGKKGVIFLGRQYIQMGQTTSLSNNIYLDVIRSHVVFIVGKRGGGKCLDGDTIIPLGDGSVRKIKDLAENNESIYTLSEDLKIKQGLKTQFYKRSVTRLLEIELRTGKKIRLTPEHPLLTVKGWIPAEKLSISSRIATPRKVETFGNKYLKESEVKLLAYLIAEGHLGNGFVLFTNSDRKIINDFKQSIYDFDKNLRVENHSHEFCFRVAQIKKVMNEQSDRNDKGQFVNNPHFDHSSIRSWIEKFNLYDKLAPEKFIPECIYTLPKYQLSLFLNRLFSCDGTIYRKSECTWTVSYCSSSYQMIIQVQHLLLRFGIISFLRHRTIKEIHTAYELVINGEYVNQFINEIGFYGRKEERAALALLESPQVIRNTNVDTIPKEIWDLYAPNNWAEIGRKIGYKHPKALRESKRYSPSRQKLLQIARADEFELLMKFASSDIFWDEIISLQQIEGNFEVYDLTVSDTHNFIANDIIVHNSYTMGVIAEGVSDLPDEVKQNISVIILDTMGVYWTMKYPNKKDELILKEWQLKSKPIDIKIYTPAGFYKRYVKEGIPTDKPFSIKPSELDATDWQLTFDVTANDPMGVLIERIVNQLKEQNIDYGIEDIIAAVKKDTNAEKSVRDAVENRFLNTISWGLFDKEGTPFLELAAGGQVTVLDVSCYATMPGGWAVKSLVVGLIAQKLFVQRMIARKFEEFGQVNSALHYFSETPQEKQDMPMVWLVIDEAHEFLPVIGKTAASDALITILREGRQPGISLILATQQPGKIHTDVMTQSDTVISHRITAKLDTEALGTLMQSYMREGLTTQLDNLPRTFGAAIIFDDTNERMYAMKIRPRISWHGGSSPVAYHGSTNTEI
ncbi:hypothetical protein HZA96_04695 [Candidatus Woesearchaeota archaeon]|nr:hypothetical protein [Candidatus Woesearchaeota archaeon]